LLIINLYNYFFGSVLLLDSIDNGDIITNENNIINQSDTERNNQSTDENIGIFQKTKRFFY
jgi:hypothetical protein